MPQWSSLCFQNAASPLMEQLIFFHNHAMTIMILVISIVAYNIISTVVKKNINAYMLEEHSLELFWTVAPALILLTLGFPSIRLLYLMDEIYSPMVTLKTVGHQWYWSYEYSDFVNVEFDSYMIPTNEMLTNGIRLIDVDNRVILPMNTQVRNLITAADVLHSWTVPSLGVKADAIPGRLNQTSFYMNVPGLFFGQCSEICGANHSFMPICVESTLPSEFIKWIKSL